MSVDKIRMLDGLVSTHCKSEPIVRLHYDNTLVTCILRLSVKKTIKISINIHIYSDTTVKMAKIDMFTVKSVTFNQ